MERQRKEVEAKELNMQVIQVEEDWRLGRDNTIIMTTESQNARAHGNQSQTKGHSLYMLYNGQWSMRTVLRPWTTMRYD